MILGAVQFPSLAAIPGLHHALSTREGGVSQGEFDSLNLAFHVSDDPLRVRRNRRLWAEKLGFEAETLVAARQIHQSRIHLVFTRDAGRGALDWESAIPDTDALMTTQRNLPLLILVADCAPILLVDTKKQVLAVVHAGWRGALAGIAAQTVAKMRHDFGSNPGDIVAGIGPCLSIENLEIGPEVAAQIAKFDAQALIAGWQKPHLDLRGLIRRDLRDAGVLESQIETMEICPKDDARFFSHRGQNGAAGRFGLIAWWQND